MKNPFKYIIPAYFDTLDGVLTLGATVLKVYDGSVPPNENGSFVLIGERTYTQDPAKGRFIGEAFVLVDVTIRGANFGFKDSDAVAEQVMALINSDSNPPTTGVQVATTSIESVNNLAGIDSRNNVYRTLIRYRHTINEL